MAAGKKIFVCTLLVLMLLSAAIIKLIVGTGSATYIIPSLFLIPIIRHWQREGGKLPKFTLNSEGFCIGNHWSLISLNNEGKRKWGKPHLFLWEDIQFFELHDRNPETNVLSWILKSGVPTPDAPQNFFFGRYRSQAGKSWALNAENAFELMILLMVAKQEEDRRRLLVRFRANA